MLVNVFIYLQHILYNVNIYLNINIVIKKHYKKKNIYIL